ncbi:MAG: hypothetical protein IT462_09830 [Planctomycetes bacterium]|nr:hypothetical protein [Planctomycetota bacterium]
MPVGSSLDTSYQIEVVGAAPAEVTRDGFDAQFTFRVFALDELSQTCLVQELTQRAVYEFADGHEEVREFALVEAFKLRLADDGSVPRRYELAPGQRDRHFLTGLSDLRPEVTGVRIDRKVFAYVANVNNADFTKRGFAQLPRNERGDVVTTVGRGFNASYQRSHQTRGEVISTNRLGGLVYRMTYHLLRFGDGPAQFTVDRGGGFGRVVKPEILVLSR